MKKYMLVQGENEVPEEVQGLNGSVYPNYCSNCRKKHQAEMKAKYSRGKKA